jgi:hypothetical protein
MLHQDEDQEGFGLYFTEDTKAHCKLTVVSTLPDIDPEYLTSVCTEVQWDANHAIDRILDQMENGKPYPRVPKQNVLKRKRDDEDDESSLDKTAAKFDNAERRQQIKAASYKRTWWALQSILPLTLLIAEKSSGRRRGVRGLTSLDHGRTDVVLVM